MVYAPDLTSTMTAERSPHGDVLIRMHEDIRALSRRYPISFSPTTIAVSYQFTSQTS
jgi:hypothetical protein